MAYEGLVAGAGLAAGELREALQAFLEGLGSADAYRRPVPAGARDTYALLAAANAPKVPYPLRNLNGSQFLRPAQDTLVSVRLDVQTESVDAVKAILVALTDLSRDFLFGLDRPRHSTLSPFDDRGLAQGVTIGFGACFFRDRRTGEPRFPDLTMPAQLDYLRLAGDSAHGIDAVASQSDLVFMAEAASFSLLVELLDRLLVLVRANPGLVVRGIDQGATRADARNHLGFLDGINNPSPYSYASAYRRRHAADVAFVDPAKEPVALRSGTYLGTRKYRIDAGGWSRLSRREQEDAVGIDFDNGGDLEPPPDGAHSPAAQRPGAPDIYRRGISYAEVRADGSSEVGLLFMSFQSSLDALVRLHDEFLLGHAHGTPDKLLAGPFITPLDAFGYFVPDHVTWNWGYVGQPFFEGERFARLFEGNDHYFNWRPEQALEVYGRLVRDFPDFFPAYANTSILYSELGDVAAADAWADRTLAVEPQNYLSFNNKAWARYLMGDYGQAITHARAAAEWMFVDDYRLFPYHTLGASLFQLGRYDDAEEALHRAAMRPRGEPLVFFSLGCLLEAMGRDAEAEAAFSYALSIVNYRVELGAASARERRALFNLKFIRTRSRRAQRVVDEVARLVRSRRWGGVTSSG